MEYPEGLTKKQTQVMDFICAEIRSKGYPPSVREIGEGLGLSSPSTVHSHLAGLESRGLIRRDPNKPRALEVLDQSLVTLEPDVPVDDGKVRFLPLVGQVAAGAPILASENIEDSLPLPAQFVGETTSFLLKVKGESMIEAGILPGDLLVVRQQPTADNGDIVVAMIDEEATVKRFFKEADRVRLQPENSSMEPIYVRDVAIVGKVVALFRAVV